MTLPLQANLLGIATAPAQCVVDSIKDGMVNQIITEVSTAEWKDDNDLVPRFLKGYIDWIASTRLNSVRGLDVFDSVTCSQGTTESFDKFYMRHPNRRFRCYRGEYLYHTLCWTASGHDWSFIDDGPLAENDAVVLSWPFADTGDKKHHDSLLDQCAGLGIPVLIDCAFFGICADHQFDFDHPAITDVCFSLSKALPVSYLRIGVRFSRDTRDGLNVYGNTHYVNKFSAAVGLRLFDIQTPDDVYDQYRAQQIAWCNQYGLRPSQCVIFGLDFDHRYDNHNRGSEDSNRICFSRYFNQGTLPL